MMILFFACILQMLPHTSQAQTKLPAAAQSAEEICPLKVGAHIPDITLPSFEGELVNLLAEIASKPTIVIFYRGGWCIYCNTQMKSLKSIEKDLLALGYQLIAISPDRPEKLRETVDRYELHYTLLSDSKAAAAQAFGLAFRVSDETLQRYKASNIDLEEASGEQHHLLPVPAAFVVGTDGVIRFSYVNPNYRVRIDPAVVLAAAKAALK